jgi:hypothetical protein
MRLADTKDFRTIDITIKYEGVEDAENFAGAEDLYSDAICEVEAR